MSLIILTVIAVFCLLPLLTYFCAKYGAVGFYNGLTYWKAKQDANQESNETRDQVH